MLKSFLFFSSESNPSFKVVEPTIEASDRDRESLRILIIGSRRGVITTIQTLHQLRFAEVREWSPLLPAPTSGEVMSILTRTIMMDA